MKINTTNPMLSKSQQRSVDADSQLSGVGASTTKSKAFSLRKKAKRANASAYVSYVALMALILSVVSVGYQSPVEDSDTSRGLSRAAIASSKPSVDQVAAAEIAAGAAAAADMSIASNVANLSISLNAKNELAQNDETALSKPRIVQGSAARGLRTYTATVGDSVPTIAAKFGVSADTVKWANNLASDAVPVGKVLEIPAINGILYTVKGGDTPESLAVKYRADKSRIVTYNDAELSGLAPGQRIVIPGGILPQNERPGYQAPTLARASTTSSYGGGYVSGIANNGNMYSYGYCTWYAFNRRAELGRPIGSMWGDAVTWASYARQAGFLVNKTPAPGAVLHAPYVAPPYGHVAIVENLHEDGSITISEMNYAGWNIISRRTIPAGQVHSYNYIH